MRIGLAPAALLAATLSMMAAQPARAQALYVGYGVPLDGGTAGMDASGGFGFDVTCLSFVCLGGEGRVGWSRGTLSTAFPGQQSRWLGGQFLHAEILLTARFLDDWIRPYAIAGPALGPMVMLAHVRGKTDDEIAAHLGVPNTAYNVDPYSLGVGGGFTLGGGTELWFGGFGFSAEARFSFLFTEASVTARPALAGTAAPDYQQTSQATQHQFVVRIGLIYDSMGRGRREEAVEPSDPMPNRPRRDEPPDAHDDWSDYDYDDGYDDDYDDPPPAERSPGPSRDAEPAAPPEVAPSPAPPPVDVAPAGPRRPAPADNAGDPGPPGAAASDPSNPQ